MTELSPQKLIEETRLYKLWRSGEGDVVNFFITDKEAGRVVYTVKCDARPLDYLGKSSAEVAIGRDILSVANHGVTDKVFDLLLETWDTIVSDGFPEEQSLWHQRQAVAHFNGLRVGMADMIKKTVDWHDPGRTYSIWMSEHAEAWPGRVAPHHLRFMISKKSISQAEDSRRS